jgi:hypothetical protein
VVFTAIHTIKRNLAHAIAALRAAAHRNGRSGTIRY